MPTLTAFYNKLVDCVRDGGSIIALDDADCYASHRLRAIDQAYRAVRALVGSINS